LSSSSVRDSPEGPLKNRGILLKTCKKQNKTHFLPKHTHTTRPTLRWPPRPTRVAQSKAPLSRFCLARGLTSPSSGFHLARGLAPPRAGSASLEGLRPLEQVPPCLRANTSLERVPPRSRANTSLEWVPPRSRARTPSSGLHHARGRAPPSSGFPPRSRLPHTRTCSRTRAQAFNALTQQSRAITRLGITPRYCSANSLRETHPRHCGGQCDEAGVSSVALCRPVPYG
jgi:hypothetical protein